MMLIFNPQIIIHGYSQCVFSQSISMLAPNYPSAVAGLRNAKLRPSLYTTVSNIQT